MDQFSFIFTIFFMLLGPFKIIPAFSAVTKGTDLKFKRDVAVKGSLIACALCVFVLVVGESLMGKYRISLDAVRIAGGLVLGISALLGIFKKPELLNAANGTSSAIHLAVNPVAIPIIVPPAGVAAILICMMQASEFPDMTKIVVISLSIIMALDFLVMYFIDQVMKPVLMLILAVLGSVLVFLQAALAIQMILVAMKSLGIIQV